ncbi:MAG: hypothetical protein Q4C70_07380 [Planctomycetia bacterium]|nr:hypothetical protein [Planctomycetia bacterium]
MTIGGWICMLCAVGCVTSLFLWCCYKVITTSDAAETQEVVEIADGSERVSEEMAGSARA